MRLRALHLDQFRKFDRPMHLDGLSDGVNVLCAPNEFGKSTLLAAIRAVLFEKHASRTDAIRGYQHRLGNTAPTVSLSFEQDGVLHRIDKRFLSRPSARLVSDGVAFEGDAAEERLATILGVSSAGRGARDAARQAASIWGALLVDQGESFAQATLGDQARATLSDCLEAELGAVGGGPAIGRLLKSVRASLGERLDGNGRPKDRMRAAIADEETAGREIADFQQRRRLLQDDLTALADARRALARDSAPGLDVQARTELDDARQHRDALLGQRARQGQATAAVALAEAERDAIAAERARRGARSEAIAANRRLLDLLIAGETESGLLAGQAGLALGKARATHLAAQAAVDDASRSVRTAQASRDAAERRTRHAALRDRLAEAETEAARVAFLTARLASLRPDQAGIVALRQAALADQGDRSALLAQATRVSLSLSVPAILTLAETAPVTVPPGPALLELNGPASLHIDGIGDIAIVPASGDQDGLLTAARQSARRLRVLLDDAGCADLDAAERAHAERGQLGLALVQAKRALATATGKTGIAALRAQEADLRPPTAEPPSHPDTPPEPPAPQSPNTAALAAETTNPASSLPKPATTAPPGPETPHAAASDTETANAAQSRLGPTDATPQTSLDQAQRALDHAQQAELAARDALHAPEQARDAARAHLAKAELDRRTHDAERTRLAAEQAQAQASDSDAALLARQDVVDTALSTRRILLAAVIDAAPEGTVTLADARIARLEQADTYRRTAVSDLRERIARLESRIAAEEGVGLDEQIEAAARRQETAARTVADDRREIAVLTLLRDTLLVADRNARERYLLPLVGRIGPYLQALFPSATVRLDEHFQIAGLRRPDLAPPGPDADGEPFGLLSHGTREQVAILARLAFADMLLASGRPAFLVLDDALAFADATRLERMFDIVGDAGRRMQILVLTCREEVASRLGGHRVRLKAGAPP